MKIVFLTLSLFLSVALFAQEKSNHKNDKKLNKQNIISVPSSKTEEIKNADFNKNTVKYAPEPFYIVNDKPVDLETYQKHQKLLAKSKK